MGKRGLKFIVLALSKAKSWLKLLVKVGLTLYWGPEETRRKLFISYFFVIGPLPQGESYKKPQVYLRRKESVIVTAVGPHKQEGREQ